MESIITTSSPATHARLVAFRSRENKRRFGSPHSNIRCRFNTTKVSRIGSLMFGFVYGAVAAVLLASSAEAYRPGDQICTYANSKSQCDLSSITPSQTDGSVLIYPGGKTRCAYDDFTDPKTGWTANATYFFQVFPKPQKKKLALIMQGNGACFDQGTCNFALQCSLPDALMVPRASANSTGILNVSDPQNPFKDWNVVFVPHCTGDLFVGNKVLDPFELGVEGMFGRPQCLGLKRKTYLNGFENTKAVFQWAKTNYPDVDELVIGGVSAGALGAQILAPYAADLWDVKAKGIKYGILADSNVGVLPDNRQAGTILDFYNGCDSELKLSSNVTAECKNHTLTVQNVVRGVLDMLPNSYLLFITSKGDDTLRLFYQLLKDGIAGYPFTNKISPEEFYARISKMLDYYQSISTHVSRFVVEGTQHVFLLTSTWYQTVSITGEVLGNFLSTWLDNVGTGKDAGATPTSSTPAPSGGTSGVRTNC